jgi:hypothetical protein
MMASIFENLRWGHERTDVKMRHVSQFIKEIVRLEVQNRNPDHRFFSPDLP